MPKQKTIYVPDLLVGARCRCNHTERDANGDEIGCDCDANYDAIYVVKPVPDDERERTPFGYCERHGGRSRTESEANRLAAERNGRSLVDA